MRSFNAPRLAGLASLFAALLFLLPAHATIVVPLSRAELIQRSDLVVRATVVGQQSQWNADHSQIVTFTRLHVTAWMKGSSESELLLEQLGGSVDGLNSRVAGDAWVNPGQQAVLFLRALNGHVYLTALAQSVYYVDGASPGTLTVRRDLTQLSFARRENGRFVIAEPPTELAETLDHLIADVTAIVRGGR